jgi:hypothetical protein
MEILHPKQRTRYRELRLQEAGIRALLWPDVAAELQLTEAQCDELDRLEKDAIKRGRGQATGALNADIERLSAIIEKLKANSLLVLTAEQKGKWDQLHGKQF